MTKGVSIKFRSYSETVPKILELVKLDSELKKHSKIVLKPSVVFSKEGVLTSTNCEFLEEVLKFCLANKNPVAEVFIAEGVDGKETMDVFNELGYNRLAEKYSVGLIDLNNTEVEKVISHHFLKHQEIIYPRILSNSFLISLPTLAASEETTILGSLSNMLGAYPAKFYKGWFSGTKSKLRKWPMKYSVFDILLCKMPDFALFDSSGKGVILAGMPLEIDKQAARLLGIDWKTVGYLRLVEESFPEAKAKPKGQISPGSSPVS